MDDGHTFQLTSRDGTTLFARHWSVKRPYATLALVHGFGEHSGRYIPMATHLAAHGVQVVAIDLRGHGRSEGKRGVIRSFDDFRADLSILLERARDLHGVAEGPLVLYGHSMGGGIVLDHGLRPEPGVAGIIASAPLVAPVDPVPATLRSLVKFIAKLLPTASMKNAISGDQVSTLPVEQTEYERDALNHDRLGLKTAVEIIENGESLTERAPAWSLPLLMMHAADDQLTDFGASQAFGSAACADFRAFPDVEHELHNDTSRPQVYQIIIDFINLLSGRV